MSQTRLTTQHDEQGAPGRCQLVVVEGAEAGRAVALDGPVLIGSGDGAQLRLSDERVSGRHARVTPEGARFRVTDLESTNGTWLEGVKVSEVVVGVGATLKVGSFGCSPWPGRSR